MTAADLGDHRGQRPVLATPGARRVRHVLSPGVGALLRAARHRQGRTAAQVAHEVGVSERHIYGLERADRAPSKVVARRLWMVLDLPLDEAQTLMAEAVPDVGLSRSDWMAS